TFAAWAARNGVTGPMTGDFNEDGLTNLAEYGLGRTSSSTGTDGFLSAHFEPLTVNSVQDTYLVLRYRRNHAADDVIVKPEMSTDMATWTTLTDEAEPAVTNPDGTEDTAWRSPQPLSSGARIYVRVNVTTR
ncbi:MAG TPA: hypothetical protein VHM91_17910, partial [Verrucomicrobiales bacterium]|nr:hypothetical protein [Verrucomicrobiales bacterium]